MNFGTFALLVAIGFGLSFVVLDISRIAGRRSWPSSHTVAGANFEPFAIFLALFAGPALFVLAFWRMRKSSDLSPVDGALAAVIAAGWACCYGLVATQCAGLLGFSML
jgi:hypothetical protein